MKKTNLITCTSLILLLFLFLPHVTSGSSAISIETKKIEEFTPRYKVNIEYPVVTSVNHPSAVKSMNEIFKNDAEKINQEAKEAIKHQLNEEPPYEFLLQYEVTFNKSGLLSVVNTGYNFTGGAHGMSYRWSYNFLTSGGQNIPLQDLFTKGSNYVEIINQAIEVQKNKYDWISPFTSIPAENQPYFMTDQGLVVYFQLYEYTPYSNGFPEFLIPYKQLDHILKPELKNKLFSS